MLPTNNQTGVAVVELITTNDRLPVRGTREVEGGRYQAMTVVVTSGNVYRGDLFVQAGILKGGDFEGAKSAVLFMGYVTSGEPGRWLGDIPADPGDLMFLECRASGAFTVRLNALMLLEGQ